MTMLIAGKKYITIAALVLFIVFTIIFLIRFKSLDYNDVSYYDGLYQPLNPVYFSTKEELLTEINKLKKRDGSVNIKEKNKGKTIEIHIKNTFSEDDSVGPTQYKAIAKLDSKGWYLEKLESASKCIRGQSLNGYCE